MAPGRADLLRRVLVKQKFKDIAKIGVEFIECARAAGHEDAGIERVWELVTGFNGYAFNKAAYGVEAYQAAWQKHYYPKNRNEFEQKGTKATNRTSSRPGRTPPEGERFSRTITT